MHLLDYNNNMLGPRFLETTMLLNLNFKIASFRYVPTDLYTPILIVNLCKAIVIKKLCENQLKRQEKLREAI